MNNIFFLFFFLLAKYEQLLSLPFFLLLLLNINTFKYHLKQKPSEKYLKKVSNLKKGRKGRKIIIVR
jgi:hypothetical protein